MHSKKKLTILAAALVCMLLVPVLASADYIQSCGVTQVSLTELSADAAGQTWLI